MRKKQPINKNVNGLNSSIHFRVKQAMREQIENMARTEELEASDIIRRALKFFFEKQQAE